MQRKGKKAVAALLGAVGVAVAADAQTTRPATTQPAAPAATRPAEANPAAPGFDQAGSDARAIEIADAVMEKMGGRQAWDRTRYIRWKFFGPRWHVWDKQTGRVRMEGVSPANGEPYVILHNINTETGRAWRNAHEVTAESELEPLVNAAERAWINDGYWVFMPYKLKDSGVTLTYLGPGTLEDDRPADILQLTFDDVGRTPDNKYHVWVARDTGLVEQWAYFSDASRAEPNLVGPWGNWKKYGRILLSDDRGELSGKPARLEIAVYDELPDAVFESFDPVDWDAIEPAGHEDGHS